MIGHLTRTERGDGGASLPQEHGAALANVGWLAAALLYGYVMYGFLGSGSYSGGPVLAAICAAAFALLLAGSARRVRRSAHYEVVAGCLMLGYSLDSLYHRQEVLLSLFLVVAVATFLGGAATSS